MFARYLNNKPKNVITNTHIENMKIPEIESLAKSPDNEFQLTVLAMRDAYEQNDIDKLKYLKSNFGLSMPGQGEYHIDRATEDGKDDMARFLVTEFKCSPSKYAKQMAQINGHNPLVSWLDQNSTQRCDVGIASVHYQFDRTTGKLGWPDFIPEQFRTFA